MESRLALDLVQALLEGYAWGAATKKLGAQVKTEDLAKLGADGLKPEIWLELKVAFESKGDSVELMEAVDLVVDRHPEVEALREYLADLVALHLIAATEYGLENEDDSEEEDGDLDEDDDYHDPRWASLEMLFETRGTEILHVLSYLKECKEADEEPSLEDFLEHFVLDEDDDTQDDIFVYEELIKQAELVEGTLKQVMQVGNAQRDETMRDLFTPLMLFFREREPKPGILNLAVLNQSALPDVHAGLLRLLNVFWTKQD